MILFSKVKYVLMKGVLPSFRKLIPAFLLFLYSCLCALIIYYVEKGHDCVSMKDFWTTLFYVGTVYTTIGYGNVNVCTPLGKGLIILFGAIGIPFALVAMDGIGLLIARASSKMWAICTSIKKALKRKFTKPKLIQVEPISGSPQRKTIRKRKNSVLGTMGSIQSQLSDDSQRAPTDGIPVLIPLILVMFWVLIMAVFFTLTEKWSYFNSIYFSFVTVSTIGFGDFSPAHVELTIVQYAIFFIGLTLFSMCVNMIQTQVESVTYHVNQQVKSEYYKRIKGEEVPEETAEETAERANSRSVLRKMPGAKYLPMMAGAMNEEDLMKELDRIANTRAAVTQTDTKIMEDDFTQTHMHIHTVATQTEAVHVQNVSWGTNTVLPVQRKPEPVSPDVHRWRF